ncbi:phosphoribosylformylglycinamidine synthase subunit PurS [Aliicoccus persicus]|uniref:Phosphoribosylformylglycinamidine synthase subunit PurS n=1 Tax=Aliicoccus persicus TaxID=930138 RepID=A0A662Z5U3_9STAP|nr:phosphoribosylformylglycinamidine synthase subunit PurS [Aliicoccus persicus]SEW03490.1 phosphoribosylformylglycinamidine synthase, purS protein [Aliicoccus persicus]
MKKIELKVTLLEPVLDTQGEALTRAVHSLGHTEVDNIEVGKVLNFTIDETDEAKIEETVKSLSEKLFTNVNIETYTYRVLEEK